MPFSELTGVECIKRNTQCLAFCFIDRPADGLRRQQRLYDQANFTAAGSALCRQNADLLYASVRIRMEHQFPDLP